MTDNSAPLVHPTPVVSVVMTMLNTARFIDETIASIRAQTMADFEFIILDGGSTDASEAIATHHASQDARIRILSLPPTNIPEARNHLLAAARCEFVAIIDSDDVALPERLARQLEVLQANPSIAALGTYAEEMHESGRIIGRIKGPTEPDDIRETLLKYCCIANPSVMLRRSQVLATGGYRTAFLRAEDYDLWLRMSERCDLVNLPEPLLRLRRRDGSSTRDGTDGLPLGTLTAQYGARERRAGRPDPTAELTTIDRASLRRIGVSEAAIRHAMREPLPRRAGPVRRLLRPLARALLRSMDDRDPLPDDWYREAEQNAAWGGGRIFVMIPAYRDRECQWTIRDLFARARYPDRITVGVVWQFDPAADRDCFEFETRPEQVRTLKFSHLKARGPVWARQQVCRLWQGEEFALQIDSHMRFVPDWDTKMLAQLALCPSPRAVLTTRPLHYDPPDRLAPDAFARMSAGTFDKQGLLGIRGFLAAMSDAPTHPLPTAFSAGGFMFGRARRLIDVPYDPHIYFFGEEISLAVRLWTAGWDLFVPNEILLYHHYVGPGQRNTPWQDDPSGQRQHAVSAARLRHLFGMEETRDRRALKDLDRYGLGRERSLADYEAYAGVCFATRTVEERAKLGEVA